MTTHAQSISQNKTRILGSRFWLLPGVFILSGILVACVLWSITLGAADIVPQTVFDAIIQSNNMDNLQLDSQTRFQYLVIQTVRFPRVLIGIVVGMALAVAGAIMQGLTRNPLADSGILGINAGASFAVVLAVFVLGTPSLSTYAYFAFVGAGFSAVLVYTLGSMGRGGATPLRLTLAGVILTAFLSSFTTAILINDQQALDKIRFWTAGSLAGRDMSIFIHVSPYVAVGLVGALLISRQITTISLGDDVAKGLGQNTTWIKSVAAIIVVLLAGGAVALAGPIGFVGLVVPHVARFIAGADYRWIIPYAMLIGGILLTVADVLARIVIRPQEVPVGLMMALCGAPFFIWLARMRVRR
jgi:iron complex transport system permease protein